MVQKRNGKHMEKHVVSCRFVSCSSVSCSNATRGTFCARRPRDGSSESKQARRLGQYYGEVWSVAWDGEHVVVHPLGGMECIGSSSSEMHVLLALSLSLSLSLFFFLKQRCPVFCLAFFFTLHLPWRLNHNGRHAVSWLFYLLFFDPLIMRYFALSLSASLSCRSDMHLCTTCICWQIE